MGKPNVLEVEIDDQRNRNLFFAPLQRKLRGRFDINRIAEPRARLKASEWPDPIPGLRVFLDLDKAEAYISDPLHEAEFAHIRERIEARGAKPAPQCETFNGVDVATWAFHLGRAVQAGAARIVSGAVPDELPGEPQREFITRRAADPMTELASAIREQTKVLAELLKR